MAFASAEGAPGRWNVSAPGRSRAVRISTKVPSTAPAGMARALRDKPELPPAGDRLGAVGGAELVEDVADVLLDRVEGDDEFLGD